MERLKKVTVIFITIMISVLFLLNTNVLAISVITNDIENQGDNIESMENYARSSEGEPVTTSDILPDGSIDDGHNHGDEIIYNPENVHEGDLYVVTGENYVMDKLVDGNVYIFAKNVKVTGQVNGSIFICASDIEIDENAYIACHMFAFADKINIKGMVLDVYSASQKLEMGENTIIYRQMKAVADEIHLAGVIGRDLSLVAEKIDVTGEEFVVYGNLDYESKSEIENKDKLNVSGETNFKKAEENEESVANVVLDYVLGAIGTVIFDALLYIALIFFAPKFVEKSKEYVSTRGLLAFAIGVAFLVAVPIVAFALMLTGFLAGLSMFMIFVYGAVLMINAFVVAIIANEFIASKIKLEDKLKKGFLLVPVSLVLWAVRKIPVVGTWISIVVCLCGVGAVILYQFDKRKEVK